MCSVNNPCSARTRNSQEMKIPSLRNCWKLENEEKWCLWNGWRFFRRREDAEVVHWDSRLFMTRALRNLCPLPPASFSIKLIESHLEVRDSSLLRPRELRLCPVAGLTVHIRLRTRVGAWISLFHLTTICQCTTSPRLRASGNYGRRTLDIYSRLLVMYTVSILAWVAILTKSAINHAARNQTSHRKWIPIFWLGLHSSFSGDIEQFSYYARF